MQHGSDINSVCTYYGTGCDITAQVEHNKIIKYMLKMMDMYHKENFV